MVKQKFNWIKDFLGVGRTKNKKKMAKVVVL